MGHGTGGLNAGHFAGHETAGHGHIGLFQRRTVIGLGSSLGGQGHGALCNGQGAVLGSHSELGSHVIFLSVLHNGRAGHSHRNRGFRCVGCGCGSAQALYGVFLSVHREGEALKAAYGMLGAVIGEAAALGLDGDGILFAFAPGVDGQGAGSGGNGVVAFGRVVLQGVAGNGVGAGTDQSLAARYGHGCQTFLTDKLTVRDFMAVVCQGGAVIGLAVAGSGQFNGNGGNAQLALVLRDGVVGSLEVCTLGIGDGVGHFILCHMGHGTGGLNAGHFAVYKAVAGHRYIGVRQRSAVILLVVGSGGQSHGALVDGQLSVRCLGYDVLTGSIHRVHGAVGKLRIIGTRVGAGDGDGNSGEVRVSGSTGVAFHSLHVSVIGFGLALGGQLYILIVVEVDHIAGGLDRNSFAGGGGNGIALNFNGGFGPRFAKSPVMQFLGWSCLFSGSIPVVVYDRIQVGASGVVQVDHVLAGSNGQGCLIGAVVFIAIDFNGFIGSHYGGSEGHVSLYLLSTQDIVGALLQIVHLIAQVGAFGVVQVNNVLAGSNGQGILIGAVVGIAIDFNGFIGSRYGGSEGHAILYLLSMQNIVGALLQIVHLIAQVGTFGIEDLDHIGAFILTNGQGQIIGVVKLVAGFGLLGVFVDHIAEHCGAGLGLGRNTNAVVVVFYGITNRLFLPAARECYILGRHGEGAVGNFRVIRIPTNEVIAGQGRLIGYIDSGAISFGSISGLCGCTCGDKSDVPILYSKVGLLPLGDKGHVVVGHGKGACLNLFLGDILRSPADELIAVLPRNHGSDSDRGAFVLREGGSTVPLTAVQIVGHLVARNILGVEGGILVQGIGEGHLAAGSGLVGVPAVEGVGHAVNFLGFGQIGNGGKVFGLGGLVVLIVGGSFPLVAGGTTGVPQVVGRGVNVSGLDLYSAVHMEVGGRMVMLGNLIGMNLNVLHIICGNADAAQLRFHGRLVGVEDLRPVSAVSGNLTAVTAAGPADHAAGNAEAVFVVFVPGRIGHVYCADAQTAGSPVVGFVGIGILIRGSQVVELCLCGGLGRIRNGNGVLRGFLGTIGTGNRQRNERLAGGNRSHKTGVIHSKDFIVAALPCHACPVRILRGNVRGKLGGRKGSHGIHTGQGHIRDRNDVPHGNVIGSNDAGRCIGDGDGSGASLHTGNDAVLGHGEGIRITALPSEVHLGTGRLGGCHQLGRDAHSYGVRTGDGEGRSLNLNFDSLGFIRMGMIPPAAAFAIGIGHGHGTCRQPLQSCRGSGTADFRLCRVSGFPFSGVITPPVCIVRTSQGNCVANIDGLLGGSNARGGSLRIRSAGQQAAQLVQNAAALGLVFHGRLLRVGGGFRSDGLAGGFAGLDGGVVHVDNPALLRAVRGIGHGGDAGGNAVDEGVQGIALGGGDGGSGEVIAGPAAALGKARGQGDGLPHGDTPIRIFLAFGQSPRGLGLRGQSPRGLGLRGLGLRGQSPFGLGPLGQSLLGLGRLRFLLRFRRNRVRGGSLLRCARICRRLGDHGLRLGHFRSRAMDSESAGGAERHDHAQSQESCNQSSLHGDVPPWIIYVKLTILYGNNGRGESLFPVYARIISCRAMSSL